MQLQLKRKKARIISIEYKLYAVFENGECHTQFWSPSI